MTRNSGSIFPARPGVALSGPAKPKGFTMRPKVRYSRILAALSVGFACILAWAAGAGPAQASPDDYSSWTSSVTLGTHISGGKQVTVSRVPGTSASLPKLAPGAKYPKEVVVVHQAAAPGPHVSPQTTVEPNSASGCTPSGTTYATCIHLVGSGLKVDSWKSDAYLCSCFSGTVSASFMVNGYVLEVYYQPFYGVGRYQSQMQNMPRTWKDGTKLCNYWYDAEGGIPCKTVKK